MSAISRRAAGLAAVLLCAGVLAGCAAPASESAAGPTPEPESSAASTTLDANRREPFDPEYLTQLAVAAERAANYWQTVLDENAIRYITTRVGMSGVVDPADDEEQTAYYLAARSRDYGPNLLGFTAEQANRLLTIDFTAEDDWSSNARFFAIDWPGTTATADDLPETPAYTWAYANNNGTITATGSVDGTPAVQYTFSIYNGSDLKWDARTVCTGGKSL